MAKSYRLRDVFTPGGMPSITYVKRENLGLERKLAGALDRGHAIITVSGPTKSGKTVLCRTIIPSNESVWVEGGRIKTEGDFWAEIASELNISSEVGLEKQNTSSETDSLAGGGNIGVPGLARVKSDLSTSHSSSTAYKRSERQSLALKRECIKRCKEQEIKIVIDDFHFISNDDQRSIVNSLKSAIFDGLDVIVIAVPHRAFDPLAVQQEMQGRFIHIEVTPWQKNELEEIVSLGFPALNIYSDDQTKNSVCDEALGNPLIVQDLCFRLCEDNGIRRTCVNLTELSGANFEKICEIVAENSGFPTFERLARGPQSRKERKMRPVRGGGEVDTYQAILLAITENSAKPVTPYDELRSAMREILEDGWLPQKNEVTAACGHMSAIAKNELENVEPIEWHNDSLVISDPFLLFFMRWQKEKIREKLIKT